MDKVPFSVYDFFAYLSSGALLMMTADLIFHGGLLQSEKIGSVLAAALLILAYVLGHVVAHFSSWLLEYGIAKRLLKSPSESLMGTPPRWKILKWLFRAYHRELSPSTQERIRDQMRVRGCAAHGEGLFQHAYPLVTAVDRYQARLDEFRNQYGFARNISFAFGVAAIALVWAHWFGPYPVKLRWAVVAVVGGLSMFYRYLKFFWQYSYELLLRYSELPNLNAKVTAKGA
jgi:hypothetical protein